MRAPLCFVIFALAACAKDVVLRDQTGSDVCGDGVRGPMEECDVDSPGCTNCLTVPGYRCEENRCFIPCENGIEGDGPSCSTPHKLLDCDMNGWWIARESDFTRDQILDAVQSSSTWFVYRLSQAGDDVRVEEMIHCGVTVTGSATVEYTKGSARGLMYANDQTPGGAHGPRLGSFRKQTSGCAFTLDPWYNVRGATLDLLPSDFTLRPTLADLPPLPSVSDPLNPPATPLPGSDDPDGDGHPGAAYLVTGIVSGTRNSAQRDFKEYATLPGQLAPLAAVEFKVPGAFDLEESVLGVRECGDVCSLVASHGYVDPSLTAYVTFRFLGNSLGYAAIDSVVAGPLRADPDTDAATCANARVALPHDPSRP